MRPAPGVNPEEGPASKSPLRIDEDGIQNRSPADVEARTSDADPDYYSKRCLL